MSEMSIALLFIYSYLQVLPYETAEVQCLLGRGWYDEDMGASPDTH